MRLLILLSSVLLVLSLWAVTALADSQSRVDPAAAQYFANVSERALKGDAAAEECLSWLYGVGFGTSIDLTEMFRWENAAAKAGSDAGKLDVAKSYAWGAGVTADPKKGLELVQELVARGYVPAETTLGILYITGTGVDENAKESVRWLTKAAAAGDFEAQIRLGSFYHWGGYVKADPVIAQKWLDKAAQHKSDCAAEYFFQIPFLINAYLDRKSIGTNESYGTFGIKFTNHGGKASDVVVFQPSGSHAVDDAWVQAVRKAKLPPWPEGYHPDAKVFGFSIPGTYEGYDPNFTAAIKASINDAKQFPKDVLVYGSKGTGASTVSFTYLDGSVSDVKITESSGEPSEDAAALAAVTNARYPATPYQYAHIKMHFSIKVNFGVYTPASPVTTAAPIGSTHQR